MLDKSDKDKLDNDKSDKIDNFAKVKLEMSFASETKLIQAAVRSLLEFLDSNNNELRLIFSELIHNAIIHGNKSDPSKRVYIRLATTDNRYNVSIRDEGSGFDPFRALESARSELALFNEHGRGMLLASALCDEISYNEVGNMVTVTGRIHLKYETS